MPIPDKNDAFKGLRALVHCTHQMSDIVFTGNLDVYTLSHSHEIYLFQSKTNYVDLIYIRFQTSVHVYRAL